MADCKYSYIEDKYRKTNPVLADRLNNQHLELVREAIDSNLFRRKDNKLYFSKEGTKKLERQLAYIEGNPYMYKTPQNTLGINVLPKEGIKLETKEVVPALEINRTEEKPIVNEKQLEEKLLQKLNSLGIAAEKIKAFQKRMGDRGTPVTVYGMADMLNKVVKYSDVQNLAEEVAHMMEAMYINSNSSIYGQVKDHPIYEQVKRDYADVYTTEEQFLREALGKLIKQVILDKNEQGVTGRLISRIKYYWNKFVDMLRGEKSLKVFLEEIVEADPSKFTVENIGDWTLYEVDTPESKILKKAIENKENRLKGMKQRLTQPLFTVALADQIAVLKQQLTEDKAELGLMKMLGYVKEDLKRTEGYLKNKPKLASADLQNLKDFVYYYKPVLEDIQRIDGYPDIDSLIGRFRKVESYYIDSKKGAVHRTMGIEVGDVIETDINRLEYYYGSLRDVGSDVARRVHALITTMKSKVFQNVYEGAKDLIMATDGVDMKRLREKINGKFTHYFVTRYKLGEWYLEEEKFMKDLKKKYNLDEDQFEPLTKKDKVAFNKERHKWKSENQERQMKPEYYEMFLNLSLETQVERDRYSLAIREILLKVTNAKKEISFEKLSDEDWQKLNNLTKERRLLGNLYYADGTKKKGSDLDIALEIKELNEKLKEHKTQNTGEYDKLWRKKKAALSDKDFKKWEERTTDTVYDDKFYEELDTITRRDYGIEYNKLKEKRNELMKPYREGDLSVQALEVPDTVVDIIRDLDEQMMEIVKGAEKKKGGKKLTDVADIVKIPEYAVAYDRAKKDGTFDEWYKRNHIKGFKGEMKAISIWTHLVPKNKSYIKRVPKSYWMEVSEDSVFYNSKFDKDWHGPQPTEKWLNPQYNDLTDTERSALDSLITMNIEAHRKYGSSERRYYQLPQDSQSFGDALTSDNKKKNVAEVIKRGLTDQVDDTQQGEVNQEGKIKQYTRPDGSQAYFIPKPYVRKLDDPEIISSDLTASVIKIRTQAEKFVESAKISSSAELLLDTLKDTKHVAKSGKITLGAETNLYKGIKSFFEDNLYGISAPPIGHVNIFGHNVNLSKVLGKVEKYVRDKNLIGNLFTVATAFTTGKAFSFIEDMVGTYTNPKSKLFANKEYYRNVHDMLMESGKKIKTNKVELIIERFHGEQDVFDDLDKSRMLRVAQETPYSPFTLVGHEMKGKTTLAMLDDTRWDGKQFITSSKYKGNKWDDLVTMYSMFEIKGNKAVVKEKYKNILTNEELAKVGNRIQFVTDRIDSKLSPTDKGVAHRHAVARLTTTHRGWLFRMTQDKFKSKGMNYITGEMEEGNYITWWNFLGRTFMRPDRIRVLKNMLLEWENLEDYEKQNVIRCLYELGTVIFIGIIARMLQSMADDDDDYFIQSAAYVANRTLLETSVYPSLLTPFTLQIGGKEFGSLLSSPIVGINTLDTFVDFYYIFDGDVIEQGRFKDLTKRERMLIKMTPGLNGYFTTTDPKSSNQFLRGKTLKPLGWVYKDKD